jgi:hypothetical protein
MMTKCLVEQRDPICDDNRWWALADNAADADLKLEADEA